jgi:hypothetical protein
MEGPEVAGELYKVFRTWLSERILQGSSAAAVTTSPKAAAGGGAEGTGPETEVAAPTTVETIAMVVTEVLAVSNIFLPIPAAAGTVLRQCVVPRRDIHCVQRVDSSRCELLASLRLLYSAVTSVFFL